jgi:hypothetical protein
VSFQRGPIPESKKKPLSNGPAGLCNEARGSRKMLELVNKLLAHA